LASLDICLWLADANNIAIAMDHIYSGSSPRTLRPISPPVDAVAFVADKSILRVRMVQYAPMASPPAVPFWHRG
jgi:hypothetical protein